MKSQLLVFSVLVALVSSGCGKSQKNKSVTAPPPPPAVEQTPTAPAPEVQVESAATPTPAPAATPAEITDISTLGAENMDADLSDYDLENHRLAQIFTMGRDLTGLKNSSGLHYTGSSVDNLLSDLLKKQNQISSAEAKSRNQKAAQSIQSIGLSIDENHRNLLVSVDILKNGKTETILLEGSLNFTNSLGQKMSLLESRNSKNPVKASLTCLDIDRECETSRLTLRMGSPEKAAVVEVILRQNYSDLHVDFPKHPETTSDYLAVETFFYNSQKSTTELNRVKEIKMNTFEVVQGVSGFQISILGYNQQFLSFKGELLAPAHGTVVSLDLDRSTTLYPKYKADLANKISDAKLVNNNGLGQLRLELQTAAKQDLGSNQIYMTFKRILKPIAYKL